MSTFMDDGGKSSDLIVVSSVEMVDTQSDELEILKEIPANDCQMMLKNKRRRRESLSSSSTGLTPPPRLIQCGNRNWLGSYDKRSNLSFVDEESPCSRRWEDMDHEILIYIMKRYPWYDWRFTNFVICKSWLSAFLDFLFPPGQVLDLRFLDLYFVDGIGPLSCEFYLRWFYRYLKLNLGRRSPDSYTKVVLSEFILHEQAYTAIARRFTSLKSFVSPEKTTSVSKQYSFRTSVVENHVFIGLCMSPYMPSLRSVCCHLSMVIPFVQYCKSIRSLTLLRRMCGTMVIDKYAECIAEGFPLLEHLSISSFVFSVKGLSMILDGLKHLQYLDLQHTVCCDEADVKVGQFRTPIKSPWPEDISKRIASVKTLLTCSGKSCTRCRHYYQPSL